MRREERRRALRVIVGLISSGGSSRVDAASRPATTHEVTIRALDYLPAVLKVRRNDIIVWRNQDPFPHTVTARGVFDSGSIGEGNIWRFIARRRGSFHYLCTFHPNMKGTLDVE